LDTKGIRYELVYIDMQTSRKEALIAAFRSAHLQEESDIYGPDVELDEIEQPEIHLPRLVVGDRDIGEYDEVQFLEDEVKTEKNSSSSPFLDLVVLIFNCMFICYFFFL